MNEPQLPKGSLEHLKKTQPRDEQDEPISLEYQSRRDFKQRRNKSSIWPIFVAAAIYWVCIVALMSTFKATVPPETSVPEWIVCTGILLVISVSIDLFFHWGWKCTAGVLFAFLLTTGLCGLLYSVCGNPFQAIL
jgi:uncharacterized membrane protein